MVKRVMRRLLPALGGLLVLGSIGCGVYTFNPAGKSSIRSIAIERFDNETAEYDLADQMTDLVIDAFIEDGALKVVSRENADAILLGVLTSYERRPFKYDENDLVESYSVTMNFQIVLSNPRDESEIFSEHMKQEGVYDVATEAESDGQERAIKRLIESIINRTTKSW